MTLLRSIVFAVATVAVAACGSGSTLPESDADLSGTVSDVRDSQDASASVLVDEDAGAVDQTIVHVRSSSRVYLVGRGGRLVAADAGELAVGDRLQVWTTGVEMRSYPRQVSAVRVHVFREGVSN
ncbi:MAG TPA: hypothetical protein VEQ60_01190 [Longimicrobium sp.]|nr:hypothetical protein [Longimicrobium sp.]